MDELSIGKLDGMARRREHARMVEELVQAQEQLRHDGLRRGATAGDKIVTGDGTRPALVL